jgi:hypothetical protein
MERVVQQIGSLNGHILSRAVLSLVLEGVTENCHASAGFVGNAKK